MSNKICDKCLNSDWSIKYNDGYIIMNCNICDNEIIFKAQNKVKMENVGDLCRVCKTPIVLKKSKFNQKKLAKPYYYTAYFYCQKCRRKYMSEKFKIVNP